MSGYTPVFGSIYQGTLCGKWPDAAVWASILPLCDKHGHIDYTAEAIAAVTGWPLDLLKRGLDGLCQPDPHSRSDSEDGRRLGLIDPARSWGWRVVNHTKYREKARLAAKSAREISQGLNAARMRDRQTNRQGTAADRRSPPLTPPQTQTQTQTQTSKKGRALPSDFELDGTRSAYANGLGLYASGEFAQFRDYHLARGTVYRDWDAAWRTWCRKAVQFGSKPPPADPKDEAANRARLADLIGGVKRIPK